MYIRSGKTLRRGRQHWQRPIISLFLFFSPCATSRARNVSFVFIVLHPLLTSNPLPPHHSDSRSCRLDLPPPLFLPFASLALSGHKSHFREQHGSFDLRLDLSTSTLRQSFLLVLGTRFCRTHSTLTRGIALTLSMPRAYCRVILRKRSLVITRVTWW